MKKYEVNFNGKKVLASEISKGKFLIEIPSENGEPEAKINISSSGVFYQSEKTSESVGPFRIGMSSEGKVAYQDESAEAPVVLAEKFNPEASNTTFPFNVVKNMFETLTELKNFQEIANNIEELRMQQLYNVLYLLGYSTPEEYKTMMSEKTSKAEKEALRTSILERVKKGNHDYSSFEALSDVGEILDEFKKLSFDSSFAEKDGEDYIYRVPDEATIARIAANIEDLKQEVKSEKALIEEKEEEIFVKQDFSKDYIDADGLKRRMGYEEWAKRDLQVRKTAQLFLALNADILPEGYATEDYTKLEDLDFQDKISDLIDTEDFDTACNVENRYYQQLNIQFVQEAIKSRASLQSTHKVSSVSDRLTELIENGEAENAEREKRNRDYEWRCKKRHVKQINLNLSETEGR